MLWDIDHTLIETGGVGAELYKSAFEEVAGTEMKNRAAVTGVTEPRIFRETMRLNGLTIGGNDLAKYSLSLAEKYDNSKQVLRGRGRALPGARGSLAALSETSGLVQSVLTGNLRRVARTKLEVFGLVDFLDLDAGAYGEDSEDRPGLVPIAQRAANTKYGSAFTVRNTIVVGDSPGDVETGQIGGARVIAVASGESDVEELRATGADIVLPDLQNTAELVTCVMALLARD